MRRILCIGGHEFSGRPEDRAFTDLIASLAGANGSRPAGEEPRVCLLPTASGDADEQRVRFFAAFADRGCAPTEVSLFKLAKRPLALRDHLLEQDLIYVGGGSLINMLAVWDAHDVASILRLAWEKGMMICGQSAGAMCWFEVGVSKGSGAARAEAGLGLLPGSCSVHYRTEPDRRKVLQDSVQTGMPDGYGIDDHAALLWAGCELAGVYSARRGATAHRVAWSEGEVVETPLASTPIEPRERVSRPAADIAEFRRARRANRRLSHRA
jgi:dipeptidase E